MMCTAAQLQHASYFRPRAFCIYKLSFVLQLQIVLEMMDHYLSICVPLALISQCLPLTFRRKATGCNFAAGDQGMRCLIKVAATTILLNSFDLIIKRNTCAVSNLNSTDVDAGSIDDDEGAYSTHATSLKCRMSMRLTLSFMIKSNANDETSHRNDLHTSQPAPANGISIDCKSNPMRQRAERVAATFVEQRTGAGDLKWKDKYIIDNEYIEIGLPASSRNYGPSARCIAFVFVHLVSESRIIQLFERKFIELKA